MAERKRNNETRFVNFAIHGISLQELSDEVLELTKT